MNIDGLSGALIAASSVPILVLNGELIVIAASDSFCETFQIEPETVQERELSELSRGEWDVPQLVGLLKGVAGGYAKVNTYEMDLRRREREPRRLALNAVRLVAGEKSVVRLLLTIIDVTEAKAAERLRVNLEHERVILLREFQHRVANSLQIIASVLLLAAQHARSDEAQGRLEDAHQRTLSVAAMQEQLAVSSEERVDLHSYFTQLCESLSACLIYDRTQMVIDLEVDDCLLAADDALSLGLIVTEMVINAIKHGFVEPRKGRILVHFRSQGDTWTLTVSDTGKGFRPSQFKPGLGTGIVAALARQLNAVHALTTSSAGTIASLSHTGQEPPAYADVMRPTTT